MVCSFRLWLVVTSIVASVAIVKRASRGLEPRRLPVWLLVLSVDCDPFRTGQVTPEQRAVLVPKREVGEPVIGGVHLDHPQPCRARQGRVDIVPCAPRVAGAHPAPVLELVGPGVRHVSQTPSSLMRSSMMSAISWSPSAVMRSATSPKSQYISTSLSSASMS